VRRSSRVSGVCNFELADSELAIVVCVLVDGMREDAAFGGECQQVVFSGSNGHEAGMSG